MKLAKENLDSIHFELLSRFNSYCWISGGAILDTLDGREPRDIDIYFPSQREQEKAVSKAKVQGAKVIQQYPLGTKLEWDGIEIDLTFLGKDPEEVFELRKDLSFFLLSVSARVLLDPLDKVTEPESIQTTVELFPRMQETVENFYYLTAEYPKRFKSTISFSNIEPVVA